MYLRVLIRGLLAYPFISAGKLINDLGRIIAGVEIPVHLTIAFHPALGYSVRRASGQISDWGTSEVAFKRLRWELDWIESEFIKKPETGKS